MQSVTFDVAEGYFPSTQILDQTTVQSILKIGTEGRVTQAWYPLEFIKSCFYQNNRRLARWCLVYIAPKSLVELRDILGVASRGEPGFSGHRWWVNPPKDEERYFRWTTWRPSPGYYLLDFQSRYGHLTRSAQDRLIQKLPQGFCRMPEAVFAQAYLGFWASGYASWIHSVQNFWGEANVGDGIVCIDRNSTEPGLRVYAAAEKLHKISTLLMNEPQFG